MSVSGSRRHRYTSPFTGPLGPSRSYSFRPKEYYTLKCTPLEIEFEKTNKKEKKDIIYFLPIQFSVYKSFPTKCFKIKRLYQSNLVA